MCGFVALINSPEAKGLDTNTSQTVLAQLTQTLHHRGPDDIGYFISDNQQVQLGHTRLSIIDINNGHQPLLTNASVLVYNGEIYNHSELRTELIGLGHHFESVCDTEVLAKAYEQWGVDFLNKLNGMFAFVLFDKQNDTVLIARDRLGIKPVYWHQTPDNKLLFGSELKAITAHPDTQVQLNPRAISDYFSLGYIPEPYSIYKGFNKLEAGHYIQLSLNNPDSFTYVNSIQYWDCLKAINSPTDSTTQQEFEQGQALLCDAIDKQTIADVPVGAFLSGGVDSSIIVSQMNRHQNVSTFSMGFDQTDYDESQQAEQVASQVQTKHTAMTVSCNTFDYLPELIKMFDEPFADNSAIPTYLLTKQAKKQVTVMLSGDGADELFLGYRNYRLLKLEGKLKNLLPKRLSTPVFKFLAKVYPELPWAPQFLRAHSTLEALNNDFVSNFHRAMSINSPEILQQIFSDKLLSQLDGYSSRHYFKTFADKVTVGDCIKKAQYIDFKTYLPGNILTKVDRTTMANSIEARVPFLDHRLVEQWISKSSDQNIKGRNAKLLLRTIAKSLIPKAVVNRRKKSFTSPMDEWFRMMTQSELRKRMQLAHLSSSEMFNMAAIDSLIEQHYSGKKNLGMTLWSLSVFAEFLKQNGMKPLIKTSDQNKK